MADHISPDFISFKKKYAAGESQILWHWVSSDLETPVSAYLKLCGNAPHSFLLESVEGGTTLGRYSIIGFEPDLLWKCKKGIIESKQTTDINWTQENGDPLTSLRKVIKDSTIKSIASDLPPMCAFGMFGYIGYDMIRLVEDIPDACHDDLNVPDSVLMRPSVLAVFDNVKNMICIATPVYTHAKNSKLSAKELYTIAADKIQSVIDTLNTPLDRSFLAHKTHLPATQSIISNTSEIDYLNSVETAKEYIRAGDIFQVVLSQRFSIDFDLPAFELYRSLRSINPSPFLFHLNFDGYALVGSSPEVLVRVRDSIATIRPIAGTRKRGATPAEDKALADDLLADEKECAEHLMLLDLGRNDIGRIAQIGSVEVTSKFLVELYSHVMHIVSNVQGKLRDNLDIIDALFAGFPAGTVSGAPKIRAMEIIDELEPTRRATYAGGIGYFSQNAMDSCIALRTALVKDGKIYVQAGAGIVADSIPQSEHQECCNKARAVIHAAQLALNIYRKTHNSY